MQIALPSTCVAFSIGRKRREEAPDRRASLEQEAPLQEPASVPKTGHGFFGGPCCGQCLTLQVPSGKEALISVRVVGVDHEIRNTEL